MALASTRRALSRSMASRIAPAIANGMQQGAAMDLLHGQKRAKGSHAENTNKFIVEVRAGPVCVDRGGDGRAAWTRMF